MSTRWQRAALVAAVAGLWSGAAAAEGVPIEPGKWEMTVTVEMPMLPQPQVMTSTECITETELSPDAMRQAEGGCKTLDVVSEGNTVRWSAECPGPAGSAKGEGRLTSHGDRIEGSMTMSVTMEGQPVRFETRWTGRRVGECDGEADRGDG